MAIEKILAKDANVVVLAHDAIPAHRAHANMIDDENWPLLISRYRKRHVLTQTAFALRFNVSQQTISRWENGQQSPHLLAQRALRSVISNASNATTECWRQRIELTQGLEMLFAPGWTILAASKPLLAALGKTSEDLCGKSLVHLLSATHQDNLAAIDVLFEHETVAFRIDAEATFSNSTTTLALELWPVSVANNDKLCHAVVHGDAGHVSPRILCDLKVQAIESLSIDQSHHVPQSELSGRASQIPVHDEYVAKTAVR